LIPHRCPAKTANSKVQNKSGDVEYQWATVINGQYSRRPACKDNQQFGFTPDAQSKSFLKTLTSQTCPQEQQAVTSDSTCVRCDLVGLAVAYLSRHDELHRTVGVHSSFKDKFGPSNWLTSATNISRRSSPTWFWKLNGSTQLATLTTPSCRTSTVIVPKRQKA